MYSGLCLTSQPHYEPILPLLFPRELYHSPVRSSKVPNGFLPRSSLLGNIFDFRSKVTPSREISQSLQTRRGSAATNLHRCSLHFSIPTQAIIIQFTYLLFLFYHIPCKHPVNKNHSSAVCYYIPRPNI